VIELPGGASTRRFFRVPHEGRTAILMYIPEPSQEIAKARQARGGGPFVEVAELLASCGVPVPRVLRRADEHQVLLVEDLGDSTLANYLRKHPETRETLYRQAVCELARAQDELSKLPVDSVVLTRAFDRDLLRWEVDHFRDWALDARNICLPPEDANVFDEAAEYLADTIARWERGFVHRDYQSRNLMVHGGPDDPKLTWIDFQDAMMGPRAYDLVALLTDSYQTFTRSFIEARLDDYCAARNIEAERERIGYEFDFITVQRKLKDAGRFIFIDRVNQNPDFLPFVDSTIDKARAALERVRDDGPLGKLHDLLNRLFNGINPSK
jgi:aminoglycoside/choline kinase family phosphotransferase